MTEEFVIRVCLREWLDVTVTVSSVSRSLAFSNSTQRVSKRGFNADFDWEYDFDSSHYNAA